MDLMIEVIMELTKKHANEMFEILQFAKETSEYNLLQQQSDTPLPDITYESTLASKKYTFTYQGRELGDLYLQMDIVGSLYVWGNWDNDVYNYQSFLNNASSAIEKYKSYELDLEEHQGNTYAI